MDLYVRVIGSLSLLLTLYFGLLVYKHAKQNI
jgi:hypothetical protein